MIWFIKTYVLKFTLYLYKIWYEVSFRLTKTIRFGKHSVGCSVHNCKLQIFPRVHMTLCQALIYWSIMWIPHIWLRHIGEYRLDGGNTTFTRRPWNGGNTNLRPTAVGSYSHFRASGYQVVLPPSRRYSPIRPRQMCGILSMTTERRTDRHGSWIRILD